MVSATGSNNLSAIHADSYGLVVSLSCIIDHCGAAILFCWIAGQLQTLGKRDVKPLSWAKLGHFL